MLCDQFKFHYSFSGDRDKPLILFLHGFMGDSNEFNEVISLLSEKFCCLAVDLPGHGRTKVIGDNGYYSMQNTAHGLINLLDNLNIEICSLIGYSMGGRLALYLNLHFPQRFSRVVLESASPGLKTERDQAERIQRDLELAHQLEIIDFPVFLLKWYSQPLFASLNKHSSFNIMLEKRLQNNPLELAKSLRGLSTGQQPSLWDKLKNNQNHLLLLVGEYDEKFRAINSEMVRLCESAQLKVISNCGHNIHFENPKEFALNLQSFLS
jgi:2-succinyl-6-hydroxy-2,4-cyclohexadiene-1-carboxylate synthase